jgi:hypothetical protein
MCADDVGSDGSFIKLSRARCLVRSQLGEGRRQFESTQANIGSKKGGEGGSKVQRKTGHKEEANTDPYVRRLSRPYSLRL